MPSVSDPSSSQGKINLAGGKPLCPRRQDLDSLLELQGITEGTLAAMGQLWRGLRAGKSGK